MKTKMNRERKRTNILKSAEYKAIQYFCERMPNWVTPNILTAIGFLGSLIILLGLWLGKEQRVFLLVSIFGLAVHWFGDSLDGRLAYYRNTPRKWFGFSLDINVDWTSVCIIALGFYFYFPAYKFVALIFVVAYGGSMIIALLRYRITNQYTIDSFYFGPTEMRILLAIVLFLEVFRLGTLLEFGVAGSALLIVFNLLESHKLLKQADQKDVAEKLKAVRNL
ncbi:MAG: CDP-alcohol phosphatidyltransferase [bacterium]